MEEAPAGGGAPAAPAPAQGPVLKQVPPEEAKNVDPEVFKHAYALSNSEANVLLASYLKQKVEKVTAYQPSPMLRKTKEYAERFSHARNEEGIKVVRTLLAKQCEPFEIPIIMNLMPETTEEAMKLLPSLQDPVRFPEDQLEQLLDEVHTYKVYCAQ